MQRKPLAHSSGTTPSQSRLLVGKPCSSSAGGPRPSSRTSSATSRSGTRANGTSGAWHSVTPKVAKWFLRARSCCAVPLLRVACEGRFEMQDGDGCSNDRPSARPEARPMQRSRFAVLFAFGLGALVALVAAPIALTGRDHRGDFAPDAHAAPLSSADASPVAQPPGQLSPLPSLAPLVKQLRPVVVNINSRFKPRRVASRRAMPSRPPSTPFDQGPGDDGSGEEDQQDPMERFFRFFGGQPSPDEGERHGLGSGFLIGDGLVLTNNHV